jgi:hypothetical protein
LLLDGPDVKSGELTGVSLYDLCPTLLWYMDAAVPAGVDGRILFEAFTEQAVDSREVRETQEIAPARQPGAVDSEQVEQRLRDLGYI